MLAQFQRPGRSNLLTIIMKWNAVVMHINCEPGVGTCKMITPYIRKKNNTTRLGSCMQVFLWICANWCRQKCNAIYSALLWERERHRERENQKDSKLKHGWTFQEFGILTCYMFLIENFILIQLVCLFLQFPIWKKTYVLGWKHDHLIQYVSSCLNLFARTCLSNFLLEQSRFWHLIQKIVKHLNHPKSS